MSVANASDNTIDYPESDGRPIGETDWHLDWTLRLRDMLKHRYRGQEVYVGSDMLLYYDKGVPRHFVVPDGFVVLDCAPHRRRIFQTWVEQKVPNVVFEFTSRSTRREDEIFKPRIYAEIGIREYFVFDPHGEYLNPQLQGHRLNEAGEYALITPDESGRLTCRELGFTLEIASDDLLIRDTTTNQPLQTEAEANARVAEANAQEAEKLANRNQSLEIEIERLKALLRQQE